MKKMDVYKSLERYNKAEKKLLDRVRSGDNDAIMEAFSQIVKMLNELLEEAKER